jgi:L-fuculose-phosphate aldolase
MPDRARTQKKRAPVSRENSPPPTAAFTVLAAMISPGAIKSEQEHRRDICAAGRWLLEHGFIVATQGNISVRLDSNRILSSPGGICKGRMDPGELVVLDLEGHKLRGTRAASSEIAMHLMIYRRRPDINSVCHAHPPVATGFAAAGLALDKALLSEVVLTLGAIPLAPYGTPGTPELPDAIEPLVENYDAILMANHGAVTFGPDLLTACYRMETTEHFARVSLVTELLGRHVLLTGEHVKKLLAARARYGLPSAPGTAVIPVAEENAPPADQLITLRQEQLAGLIDDAVRNDRGRR